MALRNELTAKNKQNFHASFVLIGMYGLKSNINVFNTFGTISSIPYLLTTFMVISDETREYFAIRVSTGYYRVGHSPLLLYYELLLIHTYHSAKW